MKRYLNKAIIYKELKASWWITLILIFIVATNEYSGFCRLLEVLQCSDEMIANTTNIYGVSKYFADVNVLPIIFIILIIISQTIIGSDRKGDFERVAAMPFTRKETIISKLAVGELVLIVPLIINFIMILSLYFYNYDIIHPYIKLGIIVKLLILNFLSYSTILSFLILIQSISGKKIAGGILGAILMFVPIGLLSLISFFVAMHLNKFEVLINVNSNLVEKVAAYSLVPLYNQLGLFPGIGYLSRVIVLICLICIFIALTYYSYKKNHFERTGNVLMFSFLEPILKMGVAVCSALMGFGIIYNIGRELMYKWNMQEGSILVMADVGLLVTGILVYFLTHKYIKANRE